MPSNSKCRPGAQRIADGEDTRVEHANDIACIRLLDDLPALGHKLLRLCETYLLAALYMVYLHAGLKLTGTDAHKRDPVTVCFVHIRLNLKYKG